MTPAACVRQSGKTLVGKPTASMIGNFRRATDAEIARLLANPEEIGEFVYGSSGHINAEGIDIEKSWHGIHYLLTGTRDEGDGPLNFILAGGQEVGDVDVGYGPARAFTSEQVRGIAGALEPI